VQSEAMGFVLVGFAGLSTCLQLVVLFILSGMNDRITRLETFKMAESEARGD